MSLEPNIALQRFSGPLEMENAFLQGLPSAEKWPVEKQIFTCPVCLFSCDTCSRLKAHFQQTDHKPTSQKMVVQSHMCKMSDKDQIPSTSTKKLLFCEVCQIACVTEERQKLHKESEKHKLMEEFENGDKTYKTLEEFIVCPKRSYPVIGLQYIVQWRTDVTSSKAFECRICKTSLNLKNMIKHITSYKHSINYMAEHYSYLFPLFKSFQTFPVRNFQVKTRAKVIEVKEATCKKQVSQNKPEEGVLKNDFHKYTIELHKKSSERAKGKQEVMDFLNTFNIESQKEVEEVQELKDKLEDVINVFCRYTERRGPKRYSKRKASEGETVTLPSKKKYLWDEKLPSKIPCATSSHSETKTPDKSSGSNNPISSTVCSSDLLDFVTEEEQEQNETVQPSTSASSLTDANITSTNADSADMTKASQVIIKKETPEGIRPKHPWVTRKSTGFEYGIWSSLTNKDDQNMSFSCPLSSKFPNPSVPSLFDNLNVDPAEENDDHEVKKKRRESTEVLATFTLFSQGRRGRNSSVTATSQSSFIKEKSSRVVKNDHDLQNDENKSGSPNEDIPQTIEQSSALYDHDEGLDTNADEELDHNSDLKYDPFHSDLESNPDEHIILDEYTDENTEGVDENVQEESMLQTDENTCSDEHSNLKDLLDEQCEGQGNRLPVDDVASSPVSKTPRKMNRDVLKRFKGKDVEVISDLLKTVSPYYEELQHVDLLEVAKVVSETGTFIGMND